jgi:hypothetical protein
MNLNTRPRCSAPMEVGFAIGSFASGVIDDHAGV